MFVNIGVIRESMEKNEDNSEFLTRLWIFENNDKCLMQVDSSHQKYLLFPSIQALLWIWKTFESVRKLRSKLGRKHKFGDRALPASFSAAIRFPIGSSTGGYSWQLRAIPPDSLKQPNHKIIKMPEAKAPKVKKVAKPAAHPPYAN